MVERLEDDNVPSAVRKGNFIIVNTRSGRTVLTIDDPGDAFIIAEARKHLNSERHSEGYKHMRSEIREAIPAIAELLSRDE